MVPLTEQDNHQRVRETHAGTWKACALRISGHAILRANPWLGASVLVTVVPALVLFAIWAGTLSHRLQLPYPPAMPEHQAVAGIMAVIQGEPLYRDWREEVPVLPLTFGVLFYEGYGALAGALGAASPGQVYSRGSALTFLGCLVLALLLALVPLGGRDRIAAGRLLPLLALTAFPYPAEWATKLLPDFPALLFGFGGWALARRGLRTKRSPLPWFAGAVVLWLITFHLKPTIIHGQVLFAAEAILRALRHGPPWRGNVLRPLLRRAVPLGACVVVVTGASVLALDRATEGLWRLNQLDSIAGRPKDFAFMAESFSLWGIGSSLALAAMVAMALLAFRRNAAFCAFLVMILFDLSMMRLQGSNVNHLLGSIVLWGIGARMLLLHLGRGRWRPAGWTARGLAGSSLVLGVALLLTLPVAPTRTWEGTRESPRHLAAAMEEIDATPAAHTLFLDAFLAMKAGETFLFADGYHAALLELDGLETFREYAERIRRREYDLIVANRAVVASNDYHNGRFAPISLYDALEEYYHLERLGSWLVIGRPGE